MRHFILTVRRYVLTYFCKFFVEIAERTHWKWPIPTLDFFIKRRGLVLGMDSKECMFQCKKWQNKAGACITAFHDFEKYMKEDKK